MTRLSKSGTALKEVGATLIIVGVMVLPVLQFIKDTVGRNSRWAATLLLMGYVVVAPFLILVGAFLSWRGRQYATKADTERIVTDSNPDVLYLRAFRSDSSIAKYLLSIFVNRHADEQELTTEEEHLRNALRPFGDLVAIGQPGERLPKPGAARIYVAGNEWKEIVQRQMRAARLVVIRAGVEENLLWEAEQAVEILDPQKVLIFVVNMKAKHYESFRTKINPRLRVPLPETATLPRYGWVVSGFISFAPDWKPRVLPFRALYEGSSPCEIFKFTLRPVFETFGVEWQPPPVPPVSTLDLPITKIITLKTASLNNRLGKFKKILRSHGATK